MSVSAAETLVTILAVYAAAGLVFAAAFAARGAGRLNPAAAKTTVWFRLLIVPGAAALWPMLAVKWRNADRKGET